MASKEGPGPKDVAALIPEVYFDLISRVPTGAFVLMLLGTDRTFPWRFDFAQFDGWTFLLFFGAAYALGLLFASFAAPIRIRYRHLAWRRKLAGKMTGEHNRNLLKTYLQRHGMSAAAEHVEQLKIFGLSAIWKIDGVVTETRRLLHDEMKGQSTEASGILPKMSAESAFFTNMQVAIVFALAAKALFAPVAVVISASSWFALIAIAQIALGFGAYGRESALRDREISYLEIFLSQHAAPGSGAVTAESAVAITGSSVGGPPPAALPRLAAPTPEEVPTPAPSPQ